MAFNGNPIQWDETNPADGRNLGLGAQDIRSLTTAVRTGIDSEHVWPAASGTAGAHRLGSARPFYGTQSAVSSAGTDGRLMQTSDTSRLFHVGSGGTSFIGGPTALSLGTYPGGAPPQRYIWVEEVGVIAAGSVTGSDTVTFPNSGFSGKPYVFASAETNTDTRGIYFGFQSLSATAVVINSFTGNNTGVSGHTLFWRSLGTRVL